MRQLFILIAVAMLAGVMSSEAAEFGVALTSTPVLNSPDFTEVFGGKSGVDLKTDRCGQVRELEFVALPGSVFTILKKHRSGPIEIYQVETDEYTAAPNIRLYVDSRFLRTEPAAIPSRRAVLPPREEIVSALKTAVGNSYVWGGNTPGGVPELSTWFYRGIQGDEKERMSLAGLDCSGLLYHATGGWTPRNTVQLLSFGKGLAIVGKSSVEIAEMLQPLDLIVWNGHVVIVLDRQTAIESRLECGKRKNGGVVVTQLSKRIGEIMRTRHPVNAWPNDKKGRDIFVVRRWHTQQQGVSKDK